MATEQSKPAGKPFKKGENVTYIASWDDNGTFYFQQAIVESCGAKQMVLRHAETGVLMGRHFRPEIGISHCASALYTPSKSGIFKGMTDEEAREVCLQEAAFYLTWRREQINDRIASATPGSPYEEGMKRTLAKLHEPEAIKR